MRKKIIIYIYRETERNKHRQANIEIELETDRQRKRECLRKIGSISLHSKTTVLKLIKKKLFLPRSSQCQAVTTGVARSAPPNTLPSSSRIELFRKLGNLLIF